MSEEVAASIGDVLAENERLKQQLAQAEERARIASAAYHQQQDATREHEARYQAMTERALAAEQDNVALRIAVRRQTEARDETLAINRELNGRLLAAGAGWSAFWEQQAHEGDVVADKLVEIAVKHHTNYAAALDTARRLVVAWRAERNVAKACLRSGVDLQDKLDAWRAATSQALAARDAGMAMDMHIALDALAELLNESEGK